ncbi:plant UBX domain-containing protein 5 isoform X2 [Raphanus sativus]|uniref:Plant UBX domain-containing protein 5 isoform X2 n=1 Tax=Raphanus sativus TaxID=3726 RepID=A0A9W3DHQ9_RAPSA|nr:plant UBX domain-containing protein 5 isoform X2 [Raphanus sativus]
MDGDHNVPPTMEENHQKMIISFITKITSSSRQLARLFLEAHQWDIDAAVSSFNEVVSVAAASARRNVTNPRDSSRTQSSNLGVVDIPVSSSSPPPIRLRSPRSPSRARNPFNREAIQRADDDFDEREHEAAKESDDDLERAPLLPSSIGQKVRSVSDILSVIPQVIPRIVTIWRNGFTLEDDNTLSTLDDPGNAIFLEVIESLKSPRVLDSPDGKRRFLVKVIRHQQEDFPDSPKPFQGVGRTLAEPDSVATDPPASSDSLTTEPTPSTDPTAPTTSIQIVLADGTRINSRFNTHHTIRDVRGLIDAATPDAASRDYHLLIMGTFPPKPLTTDLDQTIEQAGISNSVLTLKF